MTLEQQVREFYEGQRLSDAEVDAILAPGARGARRLPLVLAGVAAAAAAVVVVFLMAAPAKKTTPRVAAPAAVEDVDPNEPELVLPKNYGPPAVGARSNEPGTLSIISEPPGALVTVDGERRGVTPLRIEAIELGAHEVILERKGRRATFESIVGPAGANLRVRLEADAPAEPVPWTDDCKGAPARLSVSGVVRGCAVYWSGVRVGVAPLVDEKVPSGHCEMFISCPNGRWENTSVAVDPGRHMKHSYAEEDWFYFASPEDENYQEPPVGKRRRSPRKVERPEHDDSGVKDVYNRGAAELRAGELDEAIQTFTRCVESHPRFGLCYRALGITHARAGHGAEAYRWYKEYMRVAPDAPDARAVRQLLEAYEPAEKD